MSRICYTILIFISLFIVSAYTLNGGVSYTVETARIESFSNIDRKIDVEKYSSKFKDNDYESNKKNIAKNKLKLRNRKICFYSNGTYSVTYKSDLDVAFYYDKNGLLIYLEYELNDDFPRKSVSYDIQGELNSVIFSPSEYEQFIFDKNGKLIAHWIGNNGYNEKGELFGTRN